MTENGARRTAATSLGISLALVGAVLGAAPAGAQSGTFGTDRRYCDHSALSQVLSTTKGNLIGSAAGGAAGGLLGSQIGKSSGNTLATIVGVVGGALAGGYVGRSMDDTDQNCVGQTLEHAPANQPVAWQNQGSGSSYWATPIADLRGPNGETCRNYVTEAVVEGRAQRTENTACRQANGSWVPVSQPEMAGLQPAPAPAAAAPRAPEADASVSADTIFKVQQRLHDLGFYVRDNIDGHWGPRTAAAVKNFQRSKGLAPSGQLDLETLGALDLAQR
jgi:surface antigen